MSKQIRTLALLFALPLAACSGDSTGPGESGTGRLFGGGSITASYSGAKSGSLDASGKVEIDAKGNAKIGSYALGIIDKTGPTGGMLIIQGFQAKSGTRGDAMLLVLSESRVGTYTLGADCFDGDEMPKCAIGLVGLDVDVRDDLEVSPSTYSLESGQIQLTKINSTDAEGTFTGTAYLIDPTSGEPTGEPVEISNGKFSVKLVDINALMYGGAFSIGSTNALMNRAARASGAAHPS